MPGPTDSPLPLVGAPMAGGVSTLGFVEAVGRAGAFPFLAAGYKSAQALSKDVADLRSTVGNFGVNLFVPDGSAPDPAAIAAYAQRLSAEAERFSVSLDPTVVQDDDAWPEKVDLLVADPVPVVSLTFGLPPAADVARLRRAGSRVLATVTTLEEARAAADLGVDALVVQGSAAGGHSATHDPARRLEPVRTADLVREIKAALDLPLLAAGGVDGGDAVRSLLQAGADSVVVGTLLLLSDEAGTSPTHRAALTDPRFTGTTITHAFTGRPARSLRNRFAELYSAQAPIAYPAVHHLTRPLRQAAAAAGDADLVHLWAGTGYRQARTGPVAEILQGLASGL